MRLRHLIKQIARHIPCLVFWGMFAALMIGFSQMAGAEEIQRQDKFEAAVRNTSTSPSVILLTVVDDRTGQAGTGCAMAPFLLGALQRETGISSNRELIDVALTNPTHVFHFKKQDAIANIPFIKSRRACEAVREGLSMRMRDRSGDFIIESTGEIIAR